MYKFDEKGVLSLNKETVTDKLLRWFILVPFRWTVAYRNDVYADVALYNPFSKNIVVLPKDRYMSYHVYHHECCHGIQHERMGTIKFLWRIVWYCIRYGYNKSPMEHEANEYSAEQCSKLDTQKQIL